MKISSIINFKYKLDPEDSDEWAYSLFPSAVWYNTYSEWKDLLETLETIKDDLRNQYKSNSKIN